MAHIKYKEELLKVRELLEDSLLSKVMEFSLYEYYEPGKPEWGYKGGPLNAKNMTKGWEACAIECKINPKVNLHLKELVELFSDLQIASLDKRGDHLLILLNEDFYDSALASGRMDINLQKTATSLRNIHKNRVDNGESIKKETFELDTVIRDIEKNIPNKSSKNRQ